MQSQITTSGTRLTIFGFRDPLLIIQVFIQNSTMHSIASPPANENPIVYLCLWACFHILPRSKFELLILWSSQPSWTSPSLPWLSPQLIPLWIIPSLSTLKHINQSTSRHSISKIKLGLSPITSNLYRQKDRIAFRGPLYTKSIYLLIHGQT